MKNITEKGKIWGKSRVFVGNNEPLSKSSFTHPASRRKTNEEVKVVGMIKRHDDILNERE